MTSCDIKIDTCQDDTCLHNSTCLTGNYNITEVHTTSGPTKLQFSTSGFRQVCNCSSISTAQMGPRCQGLKRSFKKNGGFVVDLTQQSKCPSRPLPWNISFEYILLTSADDAKDATLLSIGDFMAAPRSVIVGLYNGKPFLKSGSLNETINIITALNFWHTLDVIITETNTTLLVNRCALKIGDTSPCRVVVNGAPVFDPREIKRFVIGGASPLGLPNVSNFSGCIKNVRMNKELLSLYDAERPEDNECVKEETSCPKTAGSEPKRPCGNNGFCNGFLTDVPLGQCVCHPGFYTEGSELPCSQKTMSMYFESDQTARWEFISSIWENRRKGNSRNLLPISLKFRTVVPTATLLNVEGLTNKADVPSDKFIITIGIKGETLQSSMRIGDSVWSLGFEGKVINSSDGKWHNVAYLIRGQTVQMAMDTEEGENFVISHNLPLTVENKMEIHTVERVTVGHAAYDAQIYTQLPPPNKFSGCIDDIRLFDERLDLNGTNPSAKTTSLELYSKRNAKVCGDSCPSNTCNRPMECVNLWPTGTCRFTCLDPSYPCENEGKCMLKDPKTLETFCDCPDNFRGDRCQIPVVVIAGFPWWWIVLAILLFLLLLLLLGIIYCCCILRGKRGKNESLVTQSEMELPPEKLANYATQGAGEVDYSGEIDYSHLDLNKVKYGLGSNRDRPTPIPNPSFNQPTLSNSYDAPLDYPLEYAYEGRQNSPSLSLSTIVDSVTSPGELDRPLDLRPVQDWGPQFAPISNLYNPPRTS